MVYCEVLHIKRQEVWSKNKEVSVNSDEWVLFQESENPEELGFRFERPYIYDPDSTDDIT